MNVFNGTVAPTNNYGIDNETKRYYCFLYIALNKKEHYAYVSCSDIINDEPQNLSIEFLAAEDYNYDNVSYNPSLFKEIEEVSSIMFSDIKAVESVG
jgi:hypothetical protein